LEREEDFQKRLYEFNNGLIISSFLPDISGWQDLAPNIPAFMLEPVAKVSQGLSLHLSG